MLVNKFAAKVIFITLTALGTMHAATFQFTLGASAGIAVGNTSTGVATWNADTAGNPAPFNGFIGSDTTTNFSANWTFNTSSVTGTILSATLDLGIYDLDSAATGNQIGSYAQGANSLTALLQVVSEGLNGGSGAANKEYDILSISLPNSGTLFADLAAGSPNFALTLSGPGLAVTGESTFNGAGIDFSRLTIVTQDVTPPPGTPEPAAWTLMGAGAVVLAAIRRRRC